jgi:hypothetical protein
MFRVLIVTALAVLAGCESLKEHDTAAAIAVQYATAKVIESGSTAEERSEKAARIRDIAREARTWLAGEAVSIEYLQSAAMARVAKLDLSPADRVLANALVQTAVVELHRKVGDGVIPPERLVTVNELLGWIIQATDLYGT